MDSHKKDKPRSTWPVSDARGHGALLALLLVVSLGAVGLLTAASRVWHSDRSGTPETAAPPPLEGKPEDLVSVRLPVEVNARVQRWVHHYLTDQRRLFQEYLTRGGPYAEMIREKLRARGMPEELMYLAMIESGFSTGATSRVAASGMWQFMRPTAEAYGLRVDSWVDERRDPVRATDAALDYLEGLHERFGSWYLAAAAYNAGPTRVARIVRRHGGDQTSDGELYWEIIDQLPRETREYVPKVLAATLLTREAGRYGFDVSSGRPYSFHRVFVPGGTSLRAVARSLDLPVARIRQLNPHLIRGVTPPDVSYPVRVPVGMSEQVVAALSGRRSALAD